MSDLIDALDRALAAADETITLRRMVGSAPNQVPVDVDVRAKVTASNVEIGPGGVVITTYEIIISPTQIRDGQWPSGDIPKVPPFDRDQSIPRSMTDKILMLGQPPVAISSVDPLFVNDEWVRANIKAVG